LQVPAERTDAVPEGWTTLRVQFEDEQQALFLVLGFGSKAEVLAPATLRDKVAAELAATVGLYGVSQQRSSAQATRLS